MRDATTSPDGEPAPEGPLTESGADPDPEGDGRDTTGSRPTRAPQSVLIGLSELWRRHPTLARAAVLALGCLLVGTTGYLATQPGPATTPSGTVPSATDVGGADGSSREPADSSPAGQPSDDQLELAGWTGFDAPAVRETARLTATRPTSLGVATDTAFTLTSLTSAPAAALAKGIVAEPAISFAVRRSSSADRVTLTPSSPLRPATQYRFTLKVKDAVAGSWVFRTGAPPRIVETLPRDTATGVRRDTGIEVVFDQDGVGQIAGFFSIAPEVSGRFEQHGRTWVFAPDRPLAPATVYSITVRRGVPMVGSDQVLGEDRRFAFETAPLPEPGSLPSTKRTPTWLPTPSREVIEAVPGEAPIIAFGGIPPEEKTAGVTAPVFVYRFPTFTAAVRAFTSTRDAPDWARWSERGLVPTSGLPVVTSFTGRFEELEGTPGSWIRLPGPLERGWYLVVVRRDGRDRQVHLQVSDLATYATATTTDTLAWVNDVTTGKPVADASARFDGMKLLGRSDADGLVRGTTPTIVRTSGTGTLLVRAPDAGAPERPGRAVFVPVGLDSRRPYTAEEGWSWYDGDDDPYLHVLYIDRHAYRRTDTVDAWGLVRDRATGRAPAGLDLVLTASCCDEDAPPVSTTAVRPDPIGGTFKASIPLENLPLGGYSIQTRVGGAKLEDSWLEVQEIVKPSYRVAVEADRHVLIDGDPVTVTARGTFFEDTPAAGVPLTLSGFGNLETTTDAAGLATMRSTARYPRDEWRGSYRWEEARATPVGGVAWEVPVLADQMIVFPSSVWLRSSARVTGDRLEVSAATTLVEPAAIERAEDAWSWWGEPPGPPVRGTAVRVEVTEVRTTRVQVGTVYDFIAKRVIPTYHYETNERDLGTYRAWTGSDGTTSLSVRVGFDDVRYDVHVIATDAAGRAMEDQVSARRPSTAAVAPPFEPPPTASNGLVWPSLGDEACGGRSYYADDLWGTDYPYDGYYGGYSWSPPSGYVGPMGGWRIGDPVSIPFRDRDGSLMPSGGSNRYLFVLAQRGLHQARVQSKPVFEEAFRAAWVPNVSLAAVRFTGRTYVPALSPYTLVYDASERALTVDVTTDAARYRPGGRATVSVRTTDEAGGPVSATVFVRAIDERLYAMGEVSEAQPLPDLYQNVAAGWVARYASHQLPVASAGGCYGGGGRGDTTGGGGPPPWRDDFRDSLIFARLRTGPDGRAAVVVPLSDDLTSWHVSAAAVTDKLQAGNGRTSFAVGLPFFIEAPVPAELVLGDAPTLRVRTFGTALTATSKVAVTVSAPGLGLRSRTVHVVGYGSADVPLPALPLGDQEVRISATMTSTGKTYQDALVRRVRVVATHLTVDRTVVADLAGGLPRPTSDSMTTYLFTDGGRSVHLGTLYDLAYSSGARLDEALPAVIARGILIDSFRVDPSSLPPDMLDPSRYRDGGGATLLPYSAARLDLSTRVALVAPDRFGAYGLGDYLDPIANDFSEGARERRAIALAGLAALGRPVLPDIRALLADSTLTIRERLYLALGAAALGDHATALSIERALLAAHGERLGPQVRLRVGTSFDDTLEATALLALVGVIVGDPVAPLAEAYVEAHQGREDLYRLQQIAYIQRALERTPMTPGRFAYTVGGKRHVVDLAKEGSVWLTLTPGQRAGLTATVLSGRVTVAVSYETPGNPAALAPDPSVTLQRVVVPASPIPGDSIVQVQFRVAFGPQAVPGCYWLTDVAPSGLLPTYDAIPMGIGAYESDAFGPWRIDRGRVSFCAFPGKERSVLLAYWARVIMPGTFRWDPAVIRPDPNASIGTVVPATTLTIR